MQIDRHLNVTRMRSFDVEIDRQYENTGADEMEHTYLHIS